MAINPYKQIDFVFFYIKSKEDHSASFSKEYIWNLYVSKTPEIGINKMMYDEILQKLVDDGYITSKKEEDIAKLTYNVTFKGRIFNGYEAENAALIEHNARLNALEIENQRFQLITSRNSSKLNLLTLILAIGTSIAAVYYLLEIFNHLFGFYSKN